MGVFALFGASRHMSESVESTYIDINNLRGVHLVQRVSIVVLVVLVTGVIWLSHSVQAIHTQGKILVAHRGASAYAPEHTLEAYKLAIEQRADYVEQDLQVTKDGVLVCLHDPTLDRTTNVRTIFPDRHRAGSSGNQRWYVGDFTLAEIKRLDAGSWFNEKFRGARVPTFQEAIDAVRGKAGLYPETKTPELYESGEFGMERLLTEILTKNKLDQPGADPKTPVIIQSFSEKSLRKLRVEFKTKLPLTFLINSDPDGRWLSTSGLQEIRKFAAGIGPTKGLIERDPGVVKRAHDLGLTVTPYTFRSGGTGKYPDVRGEMHHFLFTFGVDALFTDNPDLFPRTR